MGLPHILQENGISGAIPSISREPGVSTRHIRVDPLAANAILCTPASIHLFHQINPLSFLSLLLGLRHCPSLVSSGASFTPFEDRLINTTVYFPLGYPYRAWLHHDGQNTLSSPSKVSTLYSRVWTFIRFESPLTNPLPPLPRFAT